MANAKAVFIHDSYVQLRVGGDGVMHSPSEYRLSVAEARKLVDELTEAIVEITRG